MVKTRKRYSKTVVWQKDQRFLNTRNSWDNIENASNYVPTTHAAGHYTAEGTTYKKPHDVYAYDFEANIPDIAYISKIQFQVRMKCTKELVGMTAPDGIFIQYQQDIEDTVKAGQNGWYDHAYRHYGRKKLSTNYDTVHYTMEEADVQKYKNAVKTVNLSSFGIRLSFPIRYQAGEVRIEWIKLVVEYEMPNPVITYDGITVDINNPPVIPIGEEYMCRVIFLNNSNSAMENQELEVRLPFGAELVRWKIGYKSISFDQSQMKWTVGGGANAQSNLVLYFWPMAAGLKTLEVGNDTIGFYPVYFWVSSDGITDFQGYQVIPSTLQRGEESCISIYASVRSNSSTKTITCYIPYLQASDIVSCYLEDSYITDDVYLTSYEYNVNNGVNISLHLKPNTDTNIVIKLCYIPRRAGNQTISVEGFETPVTVLDAIQKSVHFNGENSKYRYIYINNNRLYSQIEGDLYVIPIGWEETDSTVYVDDSTFAIDQWKKHRYIGCVEPPYSHYDPKSNFKDKLLDEHYKNKQYVGKECTPDEEITLKIKLPKKKVPTIQGLIKIDRPIPINIIPDNWEGDPLNHRGWAEIYALEVTRTNPLYYDCDIDLKYITHNIISRFTIKRLGALNQFELPTVLEDSLSTGEKIDDFFIVDTDGTYIYDEDEPNTHKNMFSFGNKQSIVLKSKEPLASKSHIDMYWDNTIFSEFRENNVVRLVKLVNEVGRVVFEYEYYDFDFSQEIYSCRVMGRVATKNGYNAKINKSNVYLHSDIEYTEDETDVEYDEEAIDLFGSRTTFDLDSNKLTIKEHGFTGAEFTEKVELPVGNYNLVIEYKNNNNDAETSNVLTWFDFEIGELNETSKLSAYYSTLIVSPYPIPRKTIVFTRESQEGTIYYLYDDGGDFDFLLEPFYQYLCGVDLVAEESSIFDFNNSYPIIYVQNGLIRFGINRLSGDLYLDKWDYISKEYIRTNRFRIDNFDDCEVSTINDDVIVVNISDITVTMWRGRPYVMLQHENEDIQILDTFAKAFADAINQEEPLPYPAYWNLADSSNLLPECIGGTKLIKSSCIETETITSELDDIGDFIIVADKDNCMTGEPVVCTFPEQYSGKVYLVSDNQVMQATSSNGQITTSFVDDGEKVIYAVYVGDETTNMELSNQLTIHVTAKPVEESQTPVETGAIVLEYIGASEYIYGQGEWGFKLTQGGEPFPDQAIYTYAPDNTWHHHTYSNGEFHNSIGYNIKAGKHTLYAIYKDDQKMLASCKAKIVVKESTPVIKAGSLKFKEGGKAAFRLVDESNKPLENVELNLDIGGTKYVRKTSKDTDKLNGGWVGIKISKAGKYTAKVTYAGEKEKYNKVSAKFNLEVEKK